MRRISNSHSFLIFGILGAILPVSAYAESIGINFTAGGELLGTGGQPGIVAGDNWNNIIGTSGSGIQLNDDSAVATTASLTFSAGGAYDSFPYPNTPDSATDILYRGGLYDGATGISVSIRNVPYTEYAVYTYASTVDQNGGESWIQDGPTTYYYQSVPSEYQGNGNVMPLVTTLTQTMSTSASHPTVAMDQYQVFTDQTGSTINLSFGQGITNSYSNNLFGIQIVDESADAPEPASVLMLAGGFAALAALARKRR